MITQKRKRASGYCGEFPHLAQESMPATPKIPLTELFARRRTAAFSVRAPSAQGVSGD
ncbi:hypothetical protein RvY_00469 [Ramazzottius varieornatus]|uniref:Uncharacterized protein n=1 Tax=Ramazzottius varieornatus TaxID=947166 RepID=A0A1D1UMT7_RAMVA|nr:hypothetical protein RvY_00469 [Ramazzottius varieornatus]